MLLQVAALGKKQAETLKALYMVMYARRFQLKNVRHSLALSLFYCCVRCILSSLLRVHVQLKVIKEHILEFSGVVEQDAKARDGLFTKIARWKRPFVQEVMDVLGVRQLLCVDDHTSWTLVLTPDACAGRPVEEVVRRRSEAV